MLCPHCKKQINDGDTFCAFCGATISGIITPPPIQQAPAQPTGKKKSPAPILCVVGVIAVIAGGIYILPDIINARKLTPPANPADLGGQVFISTTPEAETSAAELGSQTNAASSTDETTQSSETNANADKIYDEAMSFSTNARPMLDEFEWTMGQSGFVDTPPVYAETIADPIALSGGWKAMIVYNPTSAAGTYMRELDNIDIAVNDDSCTITIDWYYMYIEGSESYREDDMEDTVFSGYVTDTGIYASGAAEIAIGYPWKYDGKEYALGALITSDGLPAYLALVRP